MSRTHKLINLAGIGFPLVGFVVAVAMLWGRFVGPTELAILAVGSMAAFTIYLRQRGSPESKPVGAPHDETASSG